MKEKKLDLFINDWEMRPMLGIMLQLIVITLVWWNRLEFSFSQSESGDLRYNVIVDTQKVSTGSSVTHISNYKMRHSQKISSFPKSTTV